MSVLISGYFALIFFFYTVGGIGDESSDFIYVSMKLQDASYIKNVTNSENGWWFSQTICDAGNNESGLSLIRSHTHVTADQNYVDRLCVCVC